MKNIFLFLALLLSEYTAFGQSVSFTLRLSSTDSNEYVVYFSSVAKSINPNRVSNLSFCVGVPSDIYPQPKLVITSPYGPVIDSGHVYSYPFLNGQTFNFYYYTICYDNNNTGPTLGYSQNSFYPMATIKLVPTVSTNNVATPRTKLFLVNMDRGASANEEMAGVCTMISFKNYSNATDPNSTFLTNPYTINGITYYPTLYSGPGSGEFFYKNLLLDPGSNATVPLPVDLLSFNCSPAATGGAVKIKWQVADERSTSSYEVERSSDGVIYNSLGAILANTHLPYKGIYEFKDNKPSIGKKYYRLRIEGNNGEVKYSATCISEISDDIRQIATLYPNPIQDELWLQYPVSNTDVSLNIALYSITGASLGAHVITITAGESRYKLPFHSLMPGRYYIRCQSQSESLILPFDKI